MGPLPSGGAKRYGDKYFTAMMYAKVREGCTAYFDKPLSKYHFMIYRFSV
jgi:hypothetical protein